MKKDSLQEKKALFKKLRLVNYRASMQLEGINLIDIDSSDNSINGLTRKEILEKYRFVKKPLHD